MSVDGSASAHCSQKENVITVTLTLFQTDIKYHFGAFFNTSLIALVLLLFINSITDLICLLPYYYIINFNLSSNVVFFCLLTRDIPKP